MSSLLTIFIEEYVLRFKEGNIMIVPSIMKGNEIIALQLHKL
jgi:hypothetical protein